VIADLLRPHGCYIADIEQGGQRMTIVHRCGSSDCPTNQGG
jgi:hypothetical protein